MVLLGRKSRAPRRQVDTQAWVVVQNSFALRPCKVTNMSDEGARLDVDGAERLPRHFNLTFSRTTRAGLRCEVRWRRGRAVGVKFIA